LFFVRHRSIKAIPIARQLNRDVPMLNRVCAVLKQFELSKTETKIAEMIEQVRTQA
jgi:hypothetical protein